jgi:class 3 adenylate cyclase/YHS domain-containing protein
VPEQTFIFADLAGFTAMTEAHGDEEAAGVAAEFCRAVRALLADHGAQEVKTIGDALMLRAGDPARAVELGLRIVEDVGAQHGFPTVRVGMHTGSAVERDGDWFGAAVNLAARVSGAASGGEVLLSDATRQAADELGSVNLRERGRQELKNVSDPVLLFAALRAGERDDSGLPIDPVCRMAVDPDRSAGTLRSRNTEFHFCSLACVEAFAAAPERYTRLR